MPRERIDDVIAKLSDVRAAERALEAKVRDGLTVPDCIQELLPSCTGWID